MKKQKEITYQEYCKKMNSIIKRNSLKNKPVHESLIEMLDEALKYKVVFEPNKKKKI
jgi:hypothetical protein